MENTFRETFFFVKKYIFSNKDDTKNVSFFFKIHMASTIKIKDFLNFFTKKLFINHDSMILILY